MTFTSANHNLELGDWITLSGIGGVTNVDGTDLNNRNYKVFGVTANTFILEEFQAVDVGAVTTPWTTFNYTLELPYIPIYPGSVEIDIGTINLTDNNNDGDLFDANQVFYGTINYMYGTIAITFPTPLSSNTEVFVRVVAQQSIVPVNTAVVAAIGGYLGGGLIATISNISIYSKVFNFFPKAQKTRINHIDFYVAETEFGEFTCNIYADSDSTIQINSPLPDNLRSNVVQTTENPYEVSDATQSIYRLYCQTQASQLQLGLTMSDQQMATDCINQSDIEIDAMIINARPSGRLI